MLYFCYVLNKWLIVSMELIQFFVIKFVVITNFVLPQQCLLQVWPSLWI